MRAPRTSFQALALLTACFALTAGAMLQMSAPAHAAAARQTADAPPAVAPAANGVAVGDGSYAPSPPASITDSKDVQATLNQHLYIDPSQAGKPVPTNQWWTDLVASKYSGDMWAYPFVSSNSSSGTKLTYPTRWNDDGTGMRLEDPITVGGSVNPTPDASDRVLADFENGVPAGWTATGTAFAATATGTNRGQSEVSGWLGSGYLNSFPDDAGDSATGTLTSPTFTLDRSTLAFLIGGGNHPDEEAVQLLVDGKVIESSTGTNSEQLQWTSWDVAAYEGKTAQVRVVDALSAGWAHILLDQMLLTDAPNGIPQRFSTAFSAKEADALRWGDWNVSWRMPQDGPGGQYMDVTAVQGSPYEWFEFHGMTPRITLADGATVTDAGGDPIALPTTTDRFEIRQDGHVFGVHAPAGTTFKQAGNAIEASVGTPYLVVSADPKSGLTLDQLQQTAFAVPRNTTMDYSYDADKGQVEQHWSVDTDALQGTNHDTVQGWLQHQYADTTNNLDFTGATYATPRGTMKTTIGHGGWTLDYSFTGMTPIGATPSSGGASPYATDVMRKYLSDYAEKTTYGGDTYWGGKDLEQLAEYMTVAKQIGDVKDAATLQNTLEKALTDWYTYSTGESEHFFAMYPTWKALIGFGDSYGSAQFNDNHFHYGYFAVATALLGQADPAFVKRFEGMATLVTKEYANWDRDDNKFPHLRTFGVWEGHSNAGGVSSPGGNNQESSSEAIQSEAGLFLLGTVLGNTHMQATGAMEYVTERAAVRDYYQNAHGNTASKTYDGNGAFPDAYQHGQAGILFDSGQAEATYFSADPAWIYGIQWMPTAPWFDYFGWDPDFSKSIMQQMMRDRPKAVGQDGVVSGNAGHIQMLTKKWWGVGSYGDTKITQDRQAAIGELEDAIRAAEANHPGYVTKKTASNPLYDNASDTLYVSVDDHGAVVFPAEYWTPTTLPASLTPAQLDSATADKQPTDWPTPSPLLPYLSTNYTADTATINRLYSVDLTDYKPGTDTGNAAAVFSGMGDALGNVVLGFLAQYDPDTYADIHAALWKANDPAVTGQSMAGMVYYQAMSNRTVGTEVINRHTSDPLSQVFRASDGTYSYVLDNTDGVQHSYNVYEDTKVIGQISVPAHTQITSHLDAHLAKIVVSTTGDPRTIVPGSSTKFEATGYDQYGATIPLEHVTWSADTGTVGEDGTYKAGDPADTATVTATVGDTKASYSFRVAAAPVLTGITITPGFDQLVVGTPAHFTAAGRDQYGDLAKLPAAPVWGYTGPGSATADGTITTSAAGSGYVTATAGGIEGSAVASSVAGIPDLSNHSTATASSTDGANTASNGLDNDPTTRWESEHGVDDVDYTIDLGSAADITTVGVNWENAAAKQYVLQVADSADGDWRDVKTVDKTDAAADSVSVGTTARFVRLHLRSRQTGYGYSIWDVHVYGTPAAATVTASDVLVAPRASAVLPSTAVHLTAYGFDRDGYGGALSGSAAPAWTVTGGGDITADGTLTSANSGGVTATVTATRGTTSGHATVTTVATGDTPTPNPSRDIAVGKPVTTSSDESGNLAGEAAVDGDSSTRWSSSAHDGEWLTVDLGETVPVDKVQIDWEAAYADSYRIQTRTNTDATWQTAAAMPHGAGGEETLSLHGVAARYVRLLADTRHTNYGVSLWNFRVYSKEGAPTPDLARGAVVSSSDDESASVPARNAVDGDSTSRWASGHTDDQWLTVDLGASEPVHQAKIRWEDAYGRGYRIQGRNASTDHWTTLASESDGDGDTDTLALNGSWRYVRLQGDERATPYGYSVYDFEIR
ncbi:discoidin domain-containing protein [Curtobacterium sp. PhB136]|uniref:discoidin domain-containing protein n=1 Tax=Curtobacterium sp. PhB136 TaxID=2485181 RepID=UPI00104FACB5|nr:discoidin domain-containing protein [Curtobacterium sp. PhB136]TCK65817.1 F5/8 type C domain-containing protein [Curtobacterium sp. PhB136]